MNITNESGRSMVEMLGVLAVIGVLSVAGITGYTQAMNKYKSNQILHLMNLTAVTAVTTLKTTSDHIAIVNSNVSSYLDVSSLPSEISMIEGYLNASDPEKVAIKVTFNSGNETVCSMVASALSNKLIKITLTPAGETPHEFNKKQCGETGTGLNDFVVAQFN